MSPRCVTTKGLVPRGTVAVIVTTKTDGDETLIFGRTGLFAVLAGC
jgi:hypothetical protein